MHICSCHPQKHPLDTDGLVEVIQQGARNMGDVCHKTAAGTGCHGCVPTLNSVKHVVEDIAEWRQNAGPNGLSPDQVAAAKKAIIDRILGR